jgi:hypothetical protein
MIGFIKLTTSNKHHQRGRLPLPWPRGLAASLTAVASALQHPGTADAMHATSEYLASGIGALTAREHGGDGHGMAERNTWGVLHMLFITQKHDETCEFGVISS